MDTNEVYNDATGTGTWTYGNPGWVSVILMF